MVLEITVAVESTLLLVAAVNLRAYTKANSSLHKQGTERVREERERSERRVDEANERAQELLRDGAAREAALLDRIQTTQDLHLAEAEPRLQPLQDRVSISDWDDRTWDELHQPEGEEVEVPE